MGASEFMIEVVGETADSAFSDAKEDAQYEHGAEGYSGTIAEKHDFVMISVPDDWSGTENGYAWHLLEEYDPRVDDKRGPAGCIKTERGYLFFGWAAS